MDKKTFVFEIMKDELKAALHHPATLSGIKNPKYEKRKEFEAYAQFLGKLYDDIKKQQQ